MLDVHAPEHRVSGARDFFVHLFTITVGLLIALGLENAAETLHHRHQRKEAEVNIREELESNRRLLREAGPAVREERANLLKLLAYLEERSSGKSLPGDRAIQIGFQEAPIPDAAWRTASSTGVLAYMEYGEVEKFSDAYKQQSMLQSEEEEALEDYLEFTPLLGIEHRDLTAEEAHEAIPAVRRALARVNGMLALGEGTLGSYDEALK